MNVRVTRLIGDGVGGSPRSKQSVYQSVCVMRREKGFEHQVCCVGVAGWLPCVNEAVAMTGKTVSSPIAFGSVVLSGRVASAEV